LPRRSRCTASSHSYPPRTGRASVKNHSQHHHQAHVYGRRWGAPCALRLQLRELKALLRSRASLRRVHQSGPRYHMRERWATLALPPGTRNTSVLHTHPPVHHGSIACRRFPTSSSQRGLHGSASTHAVHRRCLRCRSRYSRCASTQCSRRVVCGSLLVCWLGESNCARRGVRAKTRDVLRLRSWADHYHFC
jgi:hypothetical protein